ncbi:hypothetical protein LCGC14_3161950 [marine sediment metagenome]|uniref:Uncharacterized protein n=1 Tax=marine sediment metagenome TaxID=412755 RepID=A0A0F8WF57_9ZZZZ
MSEQVLRRIRKDINKIIGGASERPSRPSVMTESNLYNVHVRVTGAALVRAENMNEAQEKAASMEMGDISWGDICVEKVSPAFTTPKGSS